MCFPVTQVAGEVGKQSGGCIAYHNMAWIVAGYLLGSRQTLLETKDAGRTWEPRAVAAAQVPYCPLLFRLL